MGIYSPYEAYGRYNWGTTPYGGYYTGFSSPVSYASINYYDRPLFKYNAPYALSSGFDYYYSNPINYDYSFNSGFQYNPFHYNYNSYYAYEPFMYSAPTFDMNNYYPNSYASRVNPVLQPSQRTSWRQATPISRQNSNLRPTVSAAITLAKQELNRGVKETSTDNSTRIIQYRTGETHPEIANPWCASFTSWLYGAGQGRKCPFGYQNNSNEIAEKALAAGHFAYANSEYKPQVGDLMILQYPRGKDDEYMGGHVGIITEVHNDGTYVTIEGNYDNRVAKVTRSMNTEHLYGFVKMNEWLQNS